VASTAAPPTLVLANLVRNPTRLTIALVGVAFSVFLMAFQASLLIGFIQAAQRVVRSIDGDVWLVPHGVPCFDFSARLPRRYADLALEATGTTDVVRVVSGFTTLVRPDGARRPILLVGSEPRAGSGFPFPESADDGPHPPDGLSIDRSSAEALGSLSLPVRLEVGGLRGRVVRHVDGFASFLGSPYAFASYRDAHRMLDFADEDASFLVVRTRGDTDPARVADDLRRRLPELDVFTRDVFAFRSAWFWLTQTGAGGAILVAALLGFTIGLVITSQTMYANTMEQLDEFATLKALGADNGTLGRLVLYQAAIIGVVGALLGVGLTVPLVWLARTYLVAWIVTPWWLRAAAPCAGVAMCALGSLASVRRVLVVDPMTALRR
jgi:putative ABC transport system permease protein